MRPKSCARVNASQFQRTAVVWDLRHQTTESAQWDIMFIYPKTSKIYEKFLKTMEEDHIMKYDLPILSEIFFESLFDFSNFGAFLFARYFKRRWKTIDRRNRRKKGKRLERQWENLSPRGSEKQGKKRAEAFRSSRASK